MRRREQTRQKAWCEILEEERRTKSDISRLIYSLQHIPSTRSRMNTDSLWNLVEELESFKPASPSKSVQLTHTTEKKTVSKKYLNLRHYPSTGTSQSTPRNKKFESKSQSEEGKDSHCNNVKNNNFKKGNKNNTLKHESKSYNSRPTTSNKSQNNEKRSFENISSISKSFNKKTFIKQDFKGSHSSRSDKSSKLAYEKQQSKRSKAKLQTDSANFPVKCNYQKNGMFNNNEGERYCESKNKKNYTKSLLKDKEETNCSSTICSKPCRQDTLQVLQNISECKNNKNKTNHSSSINSDIETKSVACNQEMLTSDQSSIVKSLTNYWNNLLNNEVEMLNCKSEGQVIECFKRLEQLTSGSLQHIDVRQPLDTNFAVKSRHMSESNINILKRLENVQSNSSLKDCSSKIIGSSKPTCQIEMFSNMLSNKKLDPKSAPEGTNLNDLIYEDLPGTNLSSLEIDSEDFSNLDSNMLCCNRNNTCKYETALDISTENAIEVLEKLISILKNFPKTHLLSSQVCLPQPVKTIICLMTATVSYPLEDKFLEKSDFKKSQGHEENEGDYVNAVTIPNSFETTSPCLIPWISNDKTTSCDILIDISNFEENIIRTIEHGQMLVKPENVAVSGITLEKVPGINTATVSYLLEDKFLEESEFKKSQGHKGNEGDYINAVTIPNSFETTSSCLIQWISNNKMTSCDILIASSNFEENIIRAIENGQMLVKPEYVAVPGVTLEKVRNALKYFMIFKEVLWMEFVFNSNTFDMCNRDGDCFTPHDFTIIYEEEIILELDSDEDSNPDDEELTFFDAFRTASLYLTDIILQLTTFYWHNNIGRFVAVVYQILVSILVWKVIVKEMF